MVSHTLYTTKDTTIGTPGDYGLYSWNRMEILGDAGAIERILMEFDISSIIDVPYYNLNATLYLYQNHYDLVKETEIERVTGAWTESGAKWSNQPSVDSSPTINKTFSASVGWKTVNVVSILRIALQNSQSALGIRIKHTSEGGTDYVNQFHTKEATSNDPYLLITYDTYSQTLLYGSICKNLLMQNGWGEVTMTDHNCPSPCDAATFTFKTEWGATYSSVVLDVGDTQQYNSGTKHHSFKLYSMTANSAACDNLAAATIEEKFWEDDCYVKTTGDNDRNGRSWTEAWSTVDQAANEAFDGQEVHLGFGTYNNEPANNDITPVNFGTTGIKYTPETAGTGGGTGLATVERN